MSFDSTLWLGHAAEVVIAISLVSIGWTCFAVPTSLVRRWMSQYLKHLDQQLRFLRLDLSGLKILVTQSAASTAVVVLLGIDPTPIWGILLLAVLVLPGLYLGTLRQKRVARIEEQLHGWLLVLANALKASASLGEAIASSVTVAHAPLSQEVDLMYKEYQLGAPLDQAMETMTKRIGSRSVASILLILRIGRNTGGNLATILETSASTLRELARLEGVARSKTAEGKAQAYVISVLPFPLFGCIHWVNPQFFLPLYGNFIGHMVMTGAAALWLVAVLIARKVLVVDI